MLYTSAFCKSPIGPLLLTANDAGLCGVSLTNILPNGCTQKETPLLQTAAGQIADYFAGRRKMFSLPLSPEGTAFQRDVWEALRKIPYGETRTYGQVAQAVGQPRACRAVGMACHRNPLLIVVPCHRVIGQNGSLTGFGAGLDAKAFLLQMEKKEAQSL
ncbi:MAG: methylated-DNA--[protein]-cysteine S-methyltransferase [Oscillospiraceae bacterium]|nr:methylated-DNA--[protein]-cysteine S-methyltransferase [Caproicibacterium lactatifermentans]MDD4807061.1 methylated-DNA--[protein]-cysteine S-methyltransferase [Oscillospiraceae bacterium]